MVSLYKILGVQYMHIYIYHLSSRLVMSRGVSVYDATMCVYIYSIQYTHTYIPKTSRKSPLAFRWLATARCLERVTACSCMTKGAVLSSCHGSRWLSADRIVNNNKYIMPTGAIYNCKQKICLASTVDCLVARHNIYDNGIGKPTKDVLHRLQIDPIQPLLPVLLYIHL